MLWYILKLVVVLPLIGAMIWGSVRLSRHMQQRLGAPQGGRSVRVVETMMLSPTIRLAVLEFHGKEILVSSSRHGLARLAEAPARSAGGGTSPDSDDAFNDEADDWLASGAQANAASGTQAITPQARRPEVFTQTLRRFK